MDDTEVACGGRGGTRSARPPLRRVGEDPIGQEMGRWAESDRRFRVERGTTYSKVK